MSIKPHLFLLFLLLVLSGATAVDAGAQEIEEIIVEVQRRETSVWTTPASLEVLDHQDILNLQPNSLADLVRYQPSISFDQSNDRRGNGTFVIRGLSGNRVVMLLDGTRLPDGFGSAGVTNGRNSFEPYSMNNIQFLKGPSSALYGSDALAGVVLLRTVSPTQLLDGGDNPVFELSGGYDQVNDGFRQTLSNAGQALGGAYLLQFSARQFSESDIFGEEENFPMQGNQENLLLKWENGDQADHQTGVLMDVWRRRVDASFSADLAPGGSILDNYTEDESYRWRLGLYRNMTGVMGLDRLDLQVDLQGAGVDEDEFARRMRRGQEVLDIEEVDIDQELVSASVLAGKSWTYHEVLAGVDFVRKSAQRINYYRDYYPATGEVNPARNGVVYPLKSYPTSDTDLLGIFIQDEILLMEERLRLTLGLRYDYFNNKPEPDELYYNSNPTGQRVDAYASDNLSPSLGLAFEVNENAMLFGSYVSGFRTPPVSNQYINTFIQSRGFPHEVLANPDLISERSDGVEVGLRLRGAAGSLEVSTFRSDYEDFIESTRSGTRPNPVPGFRPVTQIQYRNLSDVQVSGTELDAELHLHNWLDTENQWLLKFSWAGLDGENKSSDEPLTSVGPHQGVVGLAFRSASGGLGADLNARMVEEFNDVPIGRFAVPAYTRVDFSLFYDVTPGFSVNFRVDNLLDEQYWYQFMAGANVRGDPASAAAPGRSVSVSARYRIGR